MNDRIIVEAIHTGTRNNNEGYYRDLIFMYDDGTWEKIFRSWAYCDITYISANRFKGLTREQAIAKLECLYYNGPIEGKFLDI